VGGHKKTRKDIRSIKLKDLAPMLSKARTVFSVQYTNHGETDPIELEKETGIHVHHFPEVVQASKFERYKLWATTPEGRTELIAITEQKEDVKRLRSQFGGEIEHVPGAAFDYGETAAFVMALTELGGRVITVNSSLVHLGGAMGIPVFTLTPDKPAWRYGLRRSDMVWYRGVRQFRQTPVGGWTNAFQELSKALDREFPTIVRATL
jgi:hypothetical protein